MQEVVRAVSIVGKHVVDGISVFADCHGFEPESVLHDTFVAVGAENHLFAVTQVDGVVGTVLFSRHIAVDALVEDYAVLEQFDNRSAVVASCGYHNFLADFEFNVEAAGEECSASAEHQFRGNERVFGSAVRRRFGDESAG